MRLMRNKGENEIIRKKYINNVLRDYFLINCRKKNVSNYWCLEEIYIYF